MKLIYLGLGSNLGDRHRHLEKALALLPSPALHITRISPTYETAPQENTAQPWFLNLVVEAETDLLPMTLLGRLQRIELALGRKRTAAKGPRTLDIDILWFGQSVIRSQSLTVPHPSAPLRRFVLEPLADLNPDLRHPVLNKTVRELLAAVRDQPLHRAPAQLSLPQRISAP